MDIPPDEYISLYLISNEVVMGRLLSTTEDEYVLFDSVYVRFGYNETTRHQYAYMVTCNPLYTKDNLLSFSKKHVIYTSPVDQEFIQLFEKFQSMEKRRGKEKTKLYNTVPSEESESLSKEDEASINELMLSMMNMANTTIH